MDVQQRSDFSDGKVLVQKLFLNQRKRFFDAKGAMVNGDAKDAQIRKERMVRNDGSDFFSEKIKVSIDYETNWPSNPIFLKCFRRVESPINSKRNRLKARSKVAKFAE